VSVPACDSGAVVLAVRAAYLEEGHEARAVLSRDVASGRRALAALVSRACRRRHVSGRSYTRRLACNKVLEKEKNNSKVPTPPHTWRTPLLHLHSL
jgi:hypothetical protein